MKAPAITALAAAAAVAGSSAATGQRYAAVDMSPAVVGGAGLVPRFFIDAPKLAVRDGGICKPNYHSCVDVGHPESCCANTNYCYVKPDSSPWCCPVGSTCDSNCPATAYQCPTIMTVTTTATVSVSRSAAAATTTATATAGSASVVIITTTSTSSACCGRACPSVSAFRCESQFGGGCCAYGQTCISNGGCLSTLSAPAPSSSAALTPADPGCTATTQHACDDGQAGCCDNLMHCTVVSGTAACAPGNPTATGGDVEYTTVPDGGGGAGGGLSAGAKAGIGVGIAVVGCALAGVLAWFCFVRRRRRRGTVTGTATMSQRSGGGRSRGVSGAASERPSRGVRALSDVTSGSRPNGPGRGATQDYFGPDAVAGPYTETEETVAAAAADGSRTETGAGTAGTPGRGRGVPLQAHSPNDVVAPVEIGDSVGGKRGYGYGYGHSVTSVPEEEAREMQTPSEETTHGRYELYGSEMVSPSTGAPPSSIVPTPSMMTPRSIASVSMFDRSPGPAPSERKRER
ncbi:hypothetical protein CORC01_09159 [Colletotrichum orchidophilum]|uniref:Uncharacterized protein n=1 Tax=Colletotrichum orchidophilum TaxID=1209926 RepID=A0A1G4B2B1_9PEZI|nr:uncharacterized protein CORC01_09159 [Colletotrichum orchidophilum]OHE95569.1 hypothetical protein CORC01_09159 [Colletotrichum orchidophilum]